MKTNRKNWLITVLVALAYAITVQVWPILAWSIFPMMWAATIWHERFFRWYGDWLFH